MGYSAENLFLQLPELAMPVSLRNKTEPHVTKQQQQAIDLMSGVGFDSSQGTNFITTPRESSWETSTVHPDTAKELTAWCRNTFNLKFSGVFYIRTKPDSIGPWHSEGPLLKGRQCALNFMIQGQEGVTSAQWGEHKHIDVPPDEIEKHFSGIVPDTDVDVIGQLHNSLYTPFFYNTACLHRSYNVNSDKSRILLSVCVADNITVKQIQKMHSNNRLIKSTAIS